MVAMSSRPYGFARDKDKTLAQDAVLWEGFLNVGRRKHRPVNLQAPFLLQLHGQSSLKSINPIYGFLSSQYKAGNKEFKNM